MFCLQGLKSQGMCVFFVHPCGEGARGCSAAAAAHLSVFACSTGGLSREKEDRQQARKRIAIKIFSPVKLMTARNHGEDLPTILVSHKRSFQFKVEWNL